MDIIKHVSGSCRSGRLLALMGHSGAGKTTLVSLGNNLSKSGGPITTRRSLLGLCSLLTMLPVGGQGSATVSEAASGALLAT